MKTTAPPSSSSPTPAAEAVRPPSAPVSTTAAAAGVSAPGLPLMPAPPAGKITRKQLAAYCGLSVRSIDELTRTGELGYFRIGKSIRYDLAEVEATLRRRFYVQAAADAAPAASRQDAPAIAVG